MLTSYFNNPALKRRRDLVKVAITLGLPKWPLGYGFAEVKELAPDGWILALEGEAFERKYREKLDRIGVETIRARLGQISEERGGEELALLCYEARRESCHRGVFAEWWEEKTGEVVVELGGDGCS
jgi:Domain of unknown function DUF488